MQLQISVWSNCVGNRFATEGVIPRRTFRSHGAVAGATEGSIGAAVQGLSGHWYWYLKPGSGGRADSTWEMMMQLAVGGGAAISSRAARSHA